MKLLILLLSTVMLSGCSSLTNVFDAAGELNDEALISAEATICRGASIGSIMRRYGTTEAKAKAWKELCTNDGSAASTILEDN